MRVMMVSPRFPKGCDVQIETRIMCKWSLIIPLILMIMVGMRVDLVRKMKDSFEKVPANLKEYLWPRIPNSPKTLEGINVGLKFQFEMLRKWGC